MNKKIKKILTEKYEWDFYSDWFTDDIKCMVDEVIEATIEANCLQKDELECVNCDQKYNESDKGSICPKCFISDLQKDDFFCNDECIDNATENWPAIKCKEQCEKCKPFDVPDTDNKELSKMCSEMSKKSIGNKLQKDEWISVEENPKEYGKYFVHRKDGKVHWETWNGSGWAYNGNVITHWKETTPPNKL